KDPALWPARARVASALFLTHKCAFRPNPFKRSSRFASAGWWRINSGSLRSTFGKGRRNRQNGDPAAETTHRFRGRTTPDTKPRPVPGSNMLPDMPIWNLLHGPDQPVKLPHGVFYFRKDRARRVH